MNQKFFRSVPLGRLLIIIYTTLLILILVIRFVEYKQTRQAVNKIQTIAENTHQELKILTAISSNNDSVKKILVQFYHDASEAKHTDIRHINQVLYMNERYFFALKKLASMQEEQMILDKLIILDHETKQLTDSLFQSVSQKKSLALLIEKQKDIFENFDNSLHRLFEVASNESEEEISKSNIHILSLARRRELGSYFFIFLLLALGLTIGNTLRKLRRTEKKYRFLFDLSPLPLFYVDQKSLYILKANQAATDKYGYSRKEFSGMQIFDLRQAKEEEIELLSIKYRNFIQTEIIWNSIANHYKKNGEVIDVEITAKKIFLYDKNTLLVVINDITEREKNEKEVTKAIIKTQEDERRSLGAELHDNVGQILVSSHLFLDIAVKDKTGNKEKYLAEARKYLTMAIKEIRDISHRVAPAFIEQISFPEVISQLLDDMNPDNNFNIHFEFDRQISAIPISTDIKLNIYRILQEQLKNILKYSKATEIKVMLGIKNHAIHMNIADNGIGFDINQVGRGIGLLNMKKRAELFSGNFSIDTAPQKGCSVTVEIPFLNGKAA